MAKGHWPWASGRGPVALAMAMTVAMAVAMAVAVTMGHGRRMIHSPWAMDHGGRGHGPLAMAVANGPWQWLRPWPWAMAGTWAMAVAMAMAMGHGRYLSKPYPFVVPKTPFWGTGVCEKNDA